MAGITPAGGPDRHSDPMTSYVMERDGKTQSEATAHLEAKEDKQSILRSVEKKGVSTDGAWFNGSQLVVEVSSSADASKVRAAGLRPSTTAGQSELDAIAESVLKKAGVNSDDIFTVGANLSKGVVDVRLSKDAPATLRAQLAKMDRVPVTTSEALTTQATPRPATT